MKLRTHRSATLAVVAGLALALGGCSTAGSDPTASPSESVALTPTAKEAVELNQPEQLRALLDAGADVNEDTGAGLTLLHVAAIRGNAEVAQVLIDAGADLDTRGGTSGKTPLMSAAESDQPELVQLLLDAGADVMLPDLTGIGTGAIHYAARGNSVASLQIFLDYGLSVDQTEPAFSTPLIYAAYNGAADAVIFLVELGADLDAVDRAGQNPLQNAEKAGYEEIADYLRNAMSE